MSTRRLCRSTEPGRVWAALCALALALGAWGNLEPCWGAAPAAKARPAVGDVVPDLKLESIEGLAVTLRPPSKKLLQIHFWNPDVVTTEEAAKAAIVLYRRFHEKGLNALTVCLSNSEERSLQMADKWNLPWPVVLAPRRANLLEVLGPIRPPFSMVVDPQGKVVGTDLRGEQAHSRLAELLGVSLAGLPMPGAPEPREIRKSPSAFGDDRDLVHGNPKIYLATTPLGANHIEIVWAARGLPGNAGRLKDSYTVYVGGQRELFADYRAELQASHSHSAGFRTICEVQASQQRYVWEASPPNKLLWYRLVLFDKAGKVAAIGDVAPGVAGENLVPQADFEPGGSAAESTGAWKLIEEVDAEESDQHSAVKVRVLAQPRPFSPGKFCLGVQTHESFILGTDLLETKPRKYLAGGWFLVTDGWMNFGRTAFDAERQNLGFAGSISTSGNSPWMFCAHRLVTDEDLSIKPGAEPWADSERANTMPGNQRFLRMQMNGHNARVLIDDTFLVECSAADEETLAALPASREVSRDEQAWMEFSERREAVLAAEEEAMEAETLSAR